MGVPDHSDLRRIETKLDANTRTTNEILNTLRGPLNKPADGLVSRVDQNEKDIRSIKSTHKTVKGWAITAIIGTAAIAAKAAWTFITTGKVPEHMP